MWRFKSPSVYMYSCLLLTFQRCILTGLYYFSLKQVNNGKCITAVICNSYTMGCPPVRGDNPRALASGLSYV